LWSLHPVMYITVWKIFVQFVYQEAIKGLKINAKFSDLCYIGYSSKYIFYSTRTNDWISLIILQILRHLGMCAGQIM
jgi:hypothetical protein